MDKHDSYFITYGPYENTNKGKRFIKEFHSIEEALKWIEHFKDAQQDGELPRQMVIYGAECLCDLS